MKVPERDKLIRWLLLLACAFISLGIFVLLCEKGLHWLGILIKGAGAIALPFVAAWLLARLTRPVVSWLSRRLHLHRGITAFIITLLVLALLAGLVWMLYMIAVNVLTEISSLMDTADSWLSDFYAQTEGLFERLGLDYETTEKYLTQSTEKMSDWALKALRLLVSLAAATPQMLVSLTITLIATYYWCRDEEKVNGMICHLLPGRGGRIYQEVTEVVNGYVRLLLILVAVAILISVLGLRLCGAAKPLPVGLLVGFFNVVPSFGPAVLLLPWALFSLLEGRGLFALGLVVIWAAIVFSRYLILPRMMSDEQGIHPLATLASLFVGLMLFGVVGIILGPVALAVTVALIKQGRSEKLITRK